VLNLLRNNFGLKLLSVFLAVAAWAYFHLAAPAITARFDQTFSVPIAIKSITPASVTLALDRVDERTVPVSIVYAGASTGVVVEAAHVDPGLTTIRGVSGDLRRVSGVRVVIPIPAKPNRLDAMLQPTPIDARGNEIAGVHVSPNLVRVRADFVTPLAPAK
jgi:hypothetical protein